MRNPSVKGTGLLPAPYVERYAFIPLLRPVNMMTLLKLADGLKMLEKLSARERRWVATHAARSPELSSSLADFVVRATPMLSGKNMPSVFLSHSHKDKPFVRSLARDLERYGIRVWLDEAELNIGDSLVTKISQVIKEIDIVVAVISASSVKSAWVLEELQWAMTHQIKGKFTKVLPVVKEPCEQPPFLAGRLFADFSSPARRKRNLEPLVSSIFHQTSEARSSK